MKTALDLPDDLFKELKLRAAIQGRKLKDVIAELLRVGLDAGGEPRPSEPIFVRNERTGLPNIVGRHPTTPGKEVTPGRIAQILLDQEVEWHREASR